MRSILALAAGFTIAALTIPVLANSAPARNADAVALLQRRVTNLERTTNYLKKQMSLQIKINNAQVRINTAVDGRVISLEAQVANPTTPTITVNSYLGAPTLISPYTWGYASASCLNGGALVGGGFNTTYPVDLGISQPNGTAWRIGAWNPYGGNTALVTPYAVCAKVSD